DQITAIHQGVEKKRGARIPDWAYRDVLFMLIDYSIRSYELLKRKMSDEEKEEAFEVFNRVGLQMGIGGLPTNLRGWEIQRASHLEENLSYSHFTEHLYQQYAKHLGSIRYHILIQAQASVCPTEVGRQLKQPRVIWLK